MAKKKTVAKKKAKPFGNTTSRNLCDTWNGILTGLMAKHMSSSEAIDVLKVYIAAKGQDQP